MEQQKLLDTKIGVIERKSLKPAIVEILKVDFKTTTKEGKIMKSPLLQLHCSHPDSDETIAITKIKILKDEKLMVVGLWCQLDNDENIQKSSSIAELLLKCQVSTIQELVGKKVQLIHESDSSKYLCIKMY